MFKQLLTMSVLVCTMAGSLFAKNNVNEVLNLQTESVWMLQEQVCTNPLQVSDFQERVIDIYLNITIRNKTYSVDIHVEKTNDTISFSMNVSVTENNTTQSITVTGSAPYSNNLTGDDITANIEGYMEDFTMDDVALILNAVFEQIED